MLAGVGQLLSFFLDWLKDLFTLYVACDVIAAFFALWVLDRVFHVFDSMRR